MWTFKRTMEKIEKPLWGVALAGSLYILTLQGAGALSTINSPKIENQSQLEQQIEVERKKIVLNDNAKIIPSFGKESFAKKIGDNVYKLSLKKGATNSTLKHELYHILAGHCDQGQRLPTGLKNPSHFLWYEPKAVIYQATGIKL